MEKEQWIVFALGVIANALFDAQKNRAENLQGAGISSAGYLTRNALRGIFFSFLASWQIEFLPYRSGEIIPLILLQAAVWWAAFDAAYNLIRWRWDAWKMLFYVGSNAPTDKIFRDAAKVIFNSYNGYAWGLQALAKTALILSTYKLLIEWNQITNFF
jgi:hypothetical protein